jgi:hypothetical protein
MKSGSRSFIAELKQVPQTWKLGKRESEELSHGNTNITICQYKPDPKL